MATTTTNEVYALNLGAQNISVFANQSTTDLATGSPVGAGLASPDNLALDHDNNIYIVEDRNGGVDNDIWFAPQPQPRRRLDRRRRGPRQMGLQRDHRLHEFTGLYFDPTDKRRAWVNIQHPASGNDRVIEITTG